MKLVNVFIGEVYSYDECYKKPDNHFHINVLVRDDSNTFQISGVIPISNNIKQLPILGENVLIFEGYNEKTKTAGPPNEQSNATPQDTVTREKIYYYFSFPINVRFGVKDNITYSNSSDKVYPAAIDEEFKQIKNLKVASLQPFKGDTLIESRWGSTIRLGSTNKENDKYYALKPKWKGVTVTDPIIVISNGQPKSTVEPNKVFKLEDIQEDTASIYLTTTQKLTNFTLGSKNKKNPLKKYKKESEFNTSQFIAVADRAVLQAKTDIAIIDSPKAILLNTTGMIKLGNDKADEPLPHGHVLYKILQKILNQLQTPIQCGTMTGTFLSNDNVSSAQQEMKNLLNKNFYITKNPY